MGCLLGIGAAVGAAKVCRIVRLFSAPVTGYVLAMTDEDARIAPLDDEARSAIREGLEQARRGEFVPESEIGDLETLRRRPEAEASKDLLIPAAIGATCYSSLTQERGDV
jgi:hypothetical protein